MKMGLGGLESARARCEGRAVLRAATEKPPGAGMSITPGRMAETCNQNPWAARTALIEERQLTHLGQACISSTRTV
jgi:hypothetical protein